MYKRSNQGRTPKKGMQEEFENTKGIIRRCIPKKDRQEEFEDGKGVIRDHIPNKDMHE